MSGPKYPIIERMRYLFLLLALPFLSVEAAAPDCNRLKDIANHLEKMIQGSPKDFHKDCEKTTPESLGLPSDSIGFSGDWDYRCKDLAAIDSQLKSIENEIALLKGIDSLKTEIIEGAATLKKYENPNQIKEASVSFINNLNVATSLELFMATNNTKSENILSKVVEDKAGWTDLNSFAGLLRKHCGSFPSTGTVCEKGFALSEETFKEINDFVTIGKSTERKFNKHQIKDLKEALEITPAGTGLEVGVIYNFGQLASELKGIQPNGLLAPEDMQVLKELPTLSGANKFDFIKNMKASMKVINDSEDLIKANGISSRFSTLLQDLKNRQEWEMKSKLSLILNQYQKQIPADATGNCDKARGLEKDSIAACLTPLSTSKELIGNEQAIVRDYISEFEYSQKQVNRLDDWIANCTPNEKLEFTDPEKCKGILTLDMAELVNKAQVLTALKAKHIQARPDLITFRNFAMEKLHSGQCMNSNDTNISCDKDLGSISLEAVALTGNAADIIHVFTKPAADTVIDQLCLDSKEVVPHKAELCELKEEDKPVKKTVNNDDYEAPVSPDGNNNVNQALADLGLSTINSLARMFAPPPQQMASPYGPPAFPYMPPVNQPQDISTRIMGPHLMQGFGSYSTTAGTMPYSSTSGGGTATGYSFGGGSHFNSPTGW